MKVKRIASVGEHADVVVAGLWHSTVEVKSDKDNDVIVTDIEGGYVMSGSADDRAGLRCGSWARGILRRRGPQRASPFPVITPHRNALWFENDASTRSRKGIGSRSPRTASSTVRLATSKTAGSARLTRRNECSAPSSDGEDRSVHRRFR
jgi:hypothetical protein